MDQQIREVRSFRDHLELNMLILNRDVTSRIYTFSASKSQHQERVITELANFQNEVNSTNSILDPLTDTVDQLHSQHQEIQANISLLQYTDALNMLDNITELVGKIEEDVSFIREEHGCGRHGGVPCNHTEGSVNSTCSTGYTGDGTLCTGRVTLEYNNYYIFIV